MSGLYRNPFVFRLSTLAPVDPLHDLPTYVGVLLVVGSSLIYGSSVLAVKRFDIGDGLFYQVVLAAALWLGGLVVHVLRGFPAFHALPMLGGVFFSVANLAVVPTIQMLGMSVSVLIWSGVELLCGWATARFGLFGVKAEVPSNPLLNYLGLALVLVSQVFYVLVSPKPIVHDEASPLPVDANDFNTPLGYHQEVKSSERLTQKTSYLSSLPTPEAHNPSNSSYSSSTIPLGRNRRKLEASSRSIYAPLLARMSPLVRHITAVLFAALIGIMLSQVNTFVLYLRNTQKRRRVSQNNIDYLFSIYTGLLLSSLAIYAIYWTVCMMSKRANHIKLFLAELILPGAITGAFLSVGGVCFMLSAQTLTQAVSYPMSNAGPPVVACLWGVLVFKEIRGTRNLCLMVAGIVCSIGGATLCAFSF